jgi:hypothetical protein
MDKGGKPAFQVFTSEESYLPSDVQWRAFANLGQPLTLSVVSAAFEENRVSDGPFLAGEVSFIVD